VGSSRRAGGLGRSAAGARASRSSGDSVWGGGEEKDSPKEELHGGVQRAGRCTGERGLPVVADVVGEIVEVHDVVEEILSTTVRSKRVQRRLVTEELLAEVEADRDGG
jgi:hypothetical protein